MDRPPWSLPVNSGAGSGHEGAAISMTAKPAGEPGHAEAFAAALRQLYEDAGSPPVAALIRRAATRAPPVTFVAQRFSDWLSGTNVPASSRVVVFLVTTL